jgi:hypothetical protein
MESVWGLLQASRLEWGRQLGEVRQRRVVWHLRRLVWLLQPQLRQHLLLGQLVQEVVDGVLVGRSNL